MEKKKGGDHCGDARKKRRKIGEEETGQKTGSPYIVPVFLVHFWWQAPRGTVKEVGLVTALEQSNVG